MKPVERYEAVIGLEVHAQLSTQTKLFCGCATQFGAKPNSNTCPVCLGLPGALPVLNRQAVEFAMRAAMATHCSFVTPKAAPHKSLFARKNYFYPDLPKGYQISQFDQPLAVNGSIAVQFDEATRKIGITRIHMEEDAGKLLHDSLGQDADKSLIDFNRSGVPLIEIVSEPELRTPEEAAAYCRKWRQLVRYLQICDGNLEQGSMRCDANVSVRPRGEKKLYTKTEIKNLNSFRHIQKALAYEIDRQITCYEQGEAVVQETRLWDADQEVTRPMRSKEEAHDYRYFAEPDLLDLQLTSEWIAAVKQVIPELPDDKLERFRQEYALSTYDALFLTQDQQCADYFEAAAAALSADKGEKERFKEIANWMMGDFTKALKDYAGSFATTKVTPKHLASLVELIATEAISGKIAKSVFAEMFQSGQTPEKIVTAKGLQQLSDEKQLRQIVEKVIDAHPKEVQQFQEGRDKLFGFFVGQVMRASQGQANPRLVNELLRAVLSK